MKLIIASDEKTPLTDAVVADVKKRGHQVSLSGALVDSTNDRWVEIGQAVAQQITNSEAEQAIIFCWSGTGVCMAANRIKGARAALCWDAETARLARKWDDANILCLSLRYTSPTLAEEILDAWFSTEFDEEGFGEAHKLDELPVNFH